MKEIIISGKNYSQICKVDDDDYEKVTKLSWYLVGGYACTYGGKTIKHLRMHNLIMGYKDNFIVDHIDRDKLNNQKSNLRHVTREENIHNQGKQLNTKNKYKGTVYDVRNNLWGSRCRIYNKDIFLGYYKSEIAAGYAYNKKASELSKYAYLNQFDISTDELEKLLISDRAYIIPADKKSKCKGVYWHKKSGRMLCGKWEAKWRVNGKYVNIGKFINEQDAIDAVEKFKKINNILDD